MSTPEPIIKVAVVQSEPVWFDLQGTVNKTIDLIIEAYEKECELIAFPEAWVPGYPLWIWDNAANLGLNIEYIKNSLSLDSPEFQSIVDAVKAHPIHTVLGFSERVHGSLYLSQCIIDKEGKVVLHRRKIKPTHVERAIYGDGKSQDLVSVKKLEFKNAGLVEVGALCCWEHAQPLVTYNSTTQQEKIHIGAWPFMDYYDSDNSAFYSLSRDACRDYARVYAMQTQTFYLFSHLIITDKILEKIGRWPPGFKRGIAAGLVYNPDGAQLTKDTDEFFDGLIIHDINLNGALLQKNLIDIVGHYSRTDLLSLNVHVSNDKTTHNEYLTNEFLKFGTDKKLDEY